MFYLVFEFVLHIILPSCVYHIMWFNIVYFFTALCILCLLWILLYQRFISICICFSCFNVAFWFLLVFRALVIHQYAYFCFQHFLVRVLFNSHNDVDGPLTTGKVYWRTCRTCYRFIRLLIIVLPVFVNSIVIK